MRIRPYIESKDFEDLRKWIDNERTHALWCANLIPYPITKENLRVFLENNAGFLKFIIINNKVRGKRDGQEMLRLALRFAFDITGAEMVQLNVFEENIVAKRCYEQVGFVERSTMRDVFSYKDELWSRCNMAVLK